MTASDPDIAALAKRLHLRGLRYRSFVPTPLPPTPVAEPDIAVEPAAMAADIEAMPPVVIPEPVPAPLPLPLPEPIAQAPAPAFFAAMPPMPAMPQAAPQVALPQFAAPTAAPMPAWRAAPLPAAAPPPVGPGTFPLLDSAFASAGQRQEVPFAVVPDAARPFSALRIALGDAGQGS